MKGKRRLSASVDGELLAAAERSASLADVTLSAWVNEAIRMKLADDAKLKALAAAIADYEREFGGITDEDMEAAQRELQRRAVKVRGLRAGEARRRYGK